MCGVFLNLLWWRKYADPCEMQSGMECTYGSSGAGGFLLLLLQRIFQKLGILRSQSLRFSPANGFDQNILYHQADLPPDLIEDKRFSTIFVDSCDKKPFINFYVKSIKNKSLKIITSTVIYCMFSLCQALFQQVERHSYSLF